MKFHPDELDAARRYAAAYAFEGLTPPQLANVRDRSRALHRWFKGHPAAHALLNVAALALLLVGDGAALLWLPRLFVEPGAAWADISGLTLLGGAVVGAAHGWLLYSLSAFSLHEGAAHRMIFPGRGRVSRLAAGVAGNLCRLGGADPVNYVQGHQSHHARFGTAEDGEFLNFVRPRRFWLTLLPFGVYVNYSDFVVHRPLTLTRSQQVSMAVSAAYHALYGSLMIMVFGPTLALVALALVFPHAAFYLDRLRQFTEHNRMPLANEHGARSFGLGLWGMLVGGGPWGQPCHWMHHLAPQLPWYQQLALHRHVKRLLTPRQRRQFLLAPVVGFPKLLWRLWTEPTACASEARSRAARRRAGLRHRAAPRTDF
jgi:hypothetical protein